MKKITRWLRSKTGLAVVASLLVVAVLLIIVGSMLGWWSLVARYLTGTTSGGVEVNLISFTAEGQRDRAVLRWQTGAERNCRGFHLYRAVKGTNTFVRVNDSLIPGKPPMGGTYDFDNMPVDRRTTYNYQLRAEGQQGQQVVIESVEVSIP